MVGKVDSGIQDASIAKSHATKQSAKSSSSLPAIPRASSSLTAATGLPQDKLSASIISFARFFSLPLKPQVLADIRRQALSLPQPQLSQNTAAANAAAANAANTTAANTAAANAAGEQAAVLKSLADAKSLAQEASSKNTLASGREALSLAAAAAESKGIELQQKALDSYVEAVDPDSRRQSDSRQRRQKDREKNEQDEKELSKTNSITSDFIKKTALDFAQNDPLLNILNKLPGKNGQRWIVLPFDFTEGDRNYFVSMRILLEEVHAREHRTTGSQRGGNCSNHVSFMVLDVLEVRSGERRVFILEASGEKVSRVSVCVWEELTIKDQRKLKEEVSKVFSISAERVNVRVCDEAFPFESRFGEEHPSIDEAV